MGTNNRIAAVWLFVPRCKKKLCSFYIPKVQLHMLFHYVDTVQLKTGWDVPPLTDFGYIWLLIPTASWHQRPAAPSAFTKSTCHYMTDTAAHLGHTDTCSCSPHCGRPRGRRGLGHRSPPAGHMSGRWSLLCSYSRTPGGRGPGRSTSRYCDRGRRHRGPPSAHT